MSGDGRGELNVARRITACLRPALEVGADVTVGELRRRLAEPDAPNAVVIDDGQLRVVDALTVLRSVLADGASASALRCCPSTVIDPDDDVHDIVAASLSREPDHRGHDLPVITHWGPRLLPAATLTELMAETAMSALQTDVLTGLPGRASTQAALEDAIREDPTRVAVAFIDLDRFKAINDVHGHAAGDRILQVVGKRLLRGVRAGDVVGRVGGDEFVVVMRVDDVAEARQAAERLVERIAQPVEQTTAIVTVEMSVGVAIGGRRMTADAQSMIADADALMYLAKQRGGGVLVAGDLTEIVVTRSQLASALSDDLLTLQYQPIVPLDGSPSTSVEALVRWPTPDGGTLQPSAFIPLAEATGQIIDLDWWALKRAVQQLVSWDRSAADQTPHRVHVNLSALTLAMPGLVSHVERMLAMEGVAPERLTLEITETAVITDIHRAKDVIGALHTLGVRTAIDDFGIGQSSLAQLSQLPVSALKIDRAFVVRLVENQVDRSVIRVVRALADELGLAVVAEGVESLDQADVLRELGITHAQGWLWAPALDARTLGDDTPTPSPTRPLPALPQRTPTPFPDAVIPNAFDPAPGPPQRVPPAAAAVAPPPFLPPGSPLGEG